jgi:hypothetical protein
MGIGNAAMMQVFGELYQTILTFPPGQRHLRIVKGGLIDLRKLFFIQYTEHPGRNADVVPWLQIPKYIIREALDQFITVYGLAAHSLTSLSHFVFLHPSRHITIKTNFVGHLQEFSYSPRLISSKSKDS